MRGGTDHVIYRLGDDLSVRLPKIGWAAQQGEKERLVRLAVARRREPPGRRVVRADERLTGVIDWGGVKGAIRPSS